MTRQFLHKKLKKNITITAIFFILILIGILTGTYIGFSIQPIPQLSIENFVKVGIDVENQTLHLISDCYSLSMIIGEEQAYSIKTGLASIRTSRPNTHDLIADMYRLFGIEVIMVKVVSIQANTYYAKLFLKQGNKILSLDARPSDAIATALRTNAPVYIKEELLASYGEKIC